MAHKDTAKTELLCHIGALLNSSLNLSETLHNAMMETTRVMNAEASSVYLLDEKTGELYYEAATGDKTAPLKTMKLQKGQGVAGWVLQNEKPVIVNDVRSDPRFENKVDSKTGFTTRSMMCVPLKVKGRTIGVLQALNKKGNKKFNDDDLDFFEDLSHQVAIAVDNAKLYSDLQEAYKKLEDLDNLKTRFIATTSHKLRTPLTAILGYAGIFQSQGWEKIREEDGRHIFEQGSAAIDRQGRYLKSLIDKIMSFVEIQGNRLEIIREPAKLKAIVDDAIDIKKEDMGDSKCLTTISIPDDLPDLYVDPDRIRAAIIECLDNVCKFCGPEPKVTLKAERKDKWLHLYIIDNGPGIPEGEQENIFM
ncbi:MAG: GAF domain-containing protein, partial [bacterium]